MSKVKIITDSTVYMPESLLKELSIDVIPLHVIWAMSSSEMGLI